MLERVRAAPALQNGVACLAQEMWRTDYHVVLGQSVDGQLPRPVSELLRN
jgi:hypothetical protein